MSEDNDILAEAKEAFEACEEGETHNRETYIEDIEFARLGKQWPDEIVKKREIEGRPCLTINKLPAYIRQVVNDSRQNKPAIKVHPVDSRSDPATAKILDGLLRNIETVSDADVAYDTAVECAVSGGFGYWRVTLDYSYDDSTDLDIAIKRVANPLSVYGDPKSRAADSSDWDVCFVTDRLSKAQYERKYGAKSDTQMTDWDDSAWSGLNGTQWKNDDGVLIAEYWTRSEIERQIVVTQDGRVFDKEALAKDPDLAAAIAQGAIKIHGERSAKSFKVKQRIMTGADVIKTMDWPGRYIPIVPVYGEEFDIEGKRYLRSMIHAAKDSQMAFNIWRTTSTEVVGLAPKVPYIGEEGAFDTDIERWNTVNTTSHPFLEYTKGKMAPQRQPLEMGVAAGAIQEAASAADDMKAIMGMYDASMGARSNETSGRAIMARQREGDVSTFNFIDNLSRSIRHTGRILIDLIPKVYDQPRIIRILGEDGAPQTVQVNQPTPQVDPKTGQPMMQPQVDPATGQPMQDPATGNPIMVPITALHDLTAGKYDLTVKAGPSFTSRREEAATQMTELMRAVPAAAGIIGPEMAKNLDWPGADEIAKKMDEAAKGVVPPQIQKQMADMQKQLQDMQQQLAQAGQENQQLKMDQSADMAKIEAQKQLDTQKLQNSMTIEQQKIQGQREIEVMKIEADKEIARAKMAGELEIKALQAQLSAQAIAPPPAPDMGMGAPFA